MVLVEGIGNKVRKLGLKNNQLKSRINELEFEITSLNAKLHEQTGKIQELEQHIADIRIRGTLHPEDSAIARQKIEGLLREIEKCQSLLNS